MPVLALKSRNFMAYTRVGVRTILTWISHIEGLKG